MKKAIKKGLVCSAFCFSRDFLNDLSPFLFPLSKSEDPKQEISSKESALIEFVVNSVKLNKLLLVTPDGYLRLSLTELTSALQSHGIEAGLGKVLAKADPLLIGGKSLSSFDVALHRTTDSLVCAGEGAAIFEKKKKPLRSGSKGNVPADRLPPGWEKAIDESGTTFYIE